MARTRYYHGCGAFTIQNKLVLIVVGDNYRNKKSVEFLLRNTSEPKWIAGKEFVRLSVRSPFNILPFDTLALVTSKFYL